MTHKIPHIQKMRAQYAYNLAQVTWLLNISPDQLHTLQFEAGLLWLTGYTKDDVEVLDELLQQPEIWAWWRNEWFRRDEISNLAALYHIAPSERWERYKAMHGEVMIQHSPSAKLLENAYSQALSTWHHNRQKNDVHTPAD